MTFRIIRGLALAIPSFLAGVFKAEVPLVRACREAQKERDEAKAELDRKLLQLAYVIDERDQLHFAITDYLNSNDDKSRVEKRQYISAYKYLQSIVQRIPGPTPRSVPVDWAPAEEKHNA